MKKITYCFTLLISMVLSTPVFSQGVVINEVLASNNSINTDEDGDYQDWVELYNSGTTAVSLNGYGLSDDPAVPFKWTFPNITIAPGAYRLIWCSDKNRINPSAPLHTNWKISSNGEIITLTNASGTAINSAPAVEMLQDISYGRLPNGTGNFTFFQVPTPNAVNSTSGSSEALPAPTFSHTGGFYNTQFNLSITTTVPGATILYTLDGSEPEAANIGGKVYSYKNSYAELVGQPNGPMLQNTYATLTYTNPVTIVNRTSQPNKLAAMSSTHHFNPTYIPTTNIFKGTVVKAKVTKPGALPSETVTHTYFVTPNGSSEFPFPMVVSLSTNEDNLFNFTDGIFTAGTKFEAWRAANPGEDSTPWNFDANFRETGETSERPANVEFFVNGDRVINQKIGIRVNGGSSRTFQSKSFRLLAKSEYGDNDFNYQFFPDEPVTVFNRLLLRNSGNDFKTTMYRDALAQSLVKGIGLDTQAYRPTVTFMNGEYWGILNLRERYDRYYFKNVHGIDEGELDLLEDALMVEEGDNDHWQEMAEFMENNNMAIQANYNYLKTQLDPENFRDYYITNIYLENVDWPGWNTEFWRKRTAYVADAPFGHDGRWRAAMKDTDAAFGISLDVNDHNTLEFATEPNGPEYPNPPFATLPIRSLLQNNDFKNDFINRFADLLNTYFLPSRVIEMSTNMRSVIQPEMARYIARWKSVEYNWWMASTNIIHTFANERPAFQRDHIRGKFGINNNISTTLNVSSADHGYIKINTIEILPTTPGVPAAAYPWTGIYFSNIPIKLKAIAKPGYMFSHWTGASTSSNAEITISSASSFSVTAVFVPDTAPQTSHPIYFWMIDNNIPNDVPLTNVSSSFETTGSDGVLQFQSSLPGYPFTPSSPDWRKASMERRNNPTEINYIMSANNNTSFASSNMKGLQVKQPFQTDGMENMMFFNFSTAGHKDIKFSFAAMDEGAAEGITVDYSTSAGAPVWTNAGMSSTSFALSNEYQLFETDFTNIAAANNNPNFKVRLRFTGQDMTQDNGGRVTFNNMAVHGTVISLDTISNSIQNFIVYPNPVADVINVMGTQGSTSYMLYTVQGRLVKEGFLSSASQINVSELSKGMYLLKLSYQGKTKTQKILKK